MYISHSSGHLDTDNCFIYWLLRVAMFMAVQISPQSLISNSFKDMCKGVCLCTPCVECTCRPEDSVEVKGVVNCHPCAGNLTQALWKGSKSLKDEPSLSTSCIFKPPSSVLTVTYPKSETSGSCGKGF